ncbi:MAG: hypothetical protein ACOXZT_04820 [Tissierellaceae bacterium]|jgi:hypothetical protein|nr:hypothetical protein [Tissierellia bacterium]
MKILLFPIILALKILEFIFKLTGRLISMCIGLVLLIVGFFLCLTIIGAILGVPLLVLGFGLIIKGFS